MVNVCFHGVGTPARDLEPGESPYWLDTAFFLTVLDLVAERADIALSFDDGNASDVTIALPALVERGLHASFFPVADRIGRTGSLDRTGLRELVEAGMTVGSHGMRHLPWRGMSACDLEAELVDARTVISEAAGVPVDLAACPRGSYDRRVLGRLRQLRYRQVFTSDRSVARAGAWLQPRFSVRSSDDAAAVCTMFASRRLGREHLVSVARIAVKRLR